VLFRSFVDSYQLLDIVPEKPLTLVDLGSGAGFPGSVLALSRDFYDVTLIESDQKKCQFLRAVSRESGVSFDVLNSRIEACVGGLSPDVVTARALAPLEKLFSYCLTWAEKNSDLVMVFLKGKSYQEELSKARETYQFDCKVHESQTDPEAVILYITRLRV